MSTLTDPGRFLSRLAQADETGRRRMWHDFSSGFVRYAPTSALVDAALDAVTEWGRVPFEEENPIWSNAIHGAFFALRGATAFSSLHDGLIPVRVLAFFDSPNVWIAGISVRYFEWFPRFREMSVPRLLEVASKETRRPKTASYSLRGVALHVLSELSPEQARLPELQDAREECIAGHLKMALEISDAPASRALYEQYCLIANRLMWL